MTKMRVFRAEPRYIPWAVRLEQQKGRTLELGEILAVYVVSGRLGAAGSRDNKSPRKKLRHEINAHLESSNASSSIADGKQGAGNESEQANGEEKEKHDEMLILSNRPG